jgi:hypothetical protein
VDTDPYPGKPKWPAGKEKKRNFIFGRALLIYKKI